LADELVLYLQLTPAFGGTRFGPFEGVEVNLGSHPDCDIVIPEAFGVAPNHVKVLRQEGMGLIITPVERTAAVFVWKGGARRPQQIATPVAVTHGDQFAMATPEGPRFTVQLDELPDEIKKQRNPLAGKRPTGAAMKKEAWRQVMFRVFATGPAQMVATWWQLFKSGSLFTPRYLFAFAGIAGGYVFGAVQACSKGEVETELTAKAEELEDCELINEGAGDGSGDFSFNNYAGKVTGVDTIGIALQSDETLAALVKERAAIILSTPSRYDWLTNPTKKSRQRSWYINFREKLKKADDLPRGSDRVMSFMAARPGITPKGWSVVKDSRGVPTCGRGPLGMTWRQAQNLGINAQLDALIEGSPRGWETDEFVNKRLELLAGTARLAGVDEIPSLEGEFEADLAVVQQGIQTCLFVDGDDYRDSKNIGRTVRELERRLKKDAKYLPRATEGAAIPTRIAAVFAADVPGASFMSKKTRPDMRQGKLSQTATLLEDRGGQWMFEQTAEVLARAITLPCIAVLSMKTTGADESAVAEVFGSPIPKPIDCIILRYTIQGQ
jgi:hypothetical protein